MNDAPIVFARHRIEVALAQKTHIVCLLNQLIDGVGITAKRVVIHANRARVLLAPLYRLFFFIAPNGIRNLRCRDRQRDRDQQDHEQYAEQQKPIFLLPSGLHRFRFGDLSHHWRSGSDCVLWYGMSSTCTETGPIFTTRYRRSTTSPSDAMKMSSPFSRKTCFCPVFSAAYP